jgi:hypothetical protein
MSAQHTGPGSQAGRAMSVQGTRRTVMSAADQDAPDRPTGEARLLVEVGRDEALDLLAGVSIGRLVFTHHALPAIRPVNHLLDSGQIIIRTRLAASVTDATGMVVAYEADDLDPIHRLGWSVVVTGTARIIDDPARIVRYTREVRPWVDLPMDVVIGIQPEIVSGYRFIVAT